MGIEGSSRDRNQISVKEGCQRNNGNASGEERHRRTFLLEPNEINNVTAHLVLDSQLSAYSVIYNLSHLLTYKEGSCCVLKSSAQPSYHFRIRSS
jgi:hypothetical protein